MKWLLSVNCAWNAWTLDQAAGHGNMKNMKWLHSVNCPWDRWMFEQAA